MGFESPSLGRRSRAALVLDRKIDRHSPPFWVVLLVQLITTESPSWAAPATRLKRAGTMVSRDEAIQWGSKRLPSDVDPVRR